MIQFYCYRHATKAKEVEAKSGLGSYIGDWKTMASKKVLKTIELCFLVEDAKAFTWERVNEAFAGGNMC